jgi:hypothetical protein
MRDCGGAARQWEARYERGEPLVDLLFLREMHLAAVLNGAIVAFPNKRD